MNVAKFLRSFRYAITGIVTACREQNMRVHVISCLVVILAGIGTGLSAIEWCMIVFICAAVMGAEMINTAIERVVDLASPNVHPLAKAAKDVAAGAVLVFAVASVIIGVLIFFPKWFNFF